MEVPSAIVGFELLEGSPIAVFLAEDVRLLVLAVERINGSTDVVKSGIAVCLDVSLHLAAVVKQAVFGFNKVLM